MSNYSWNNEKQCYEEDPLSINNSKDDYINAQKVINKHRSQIIHGLKYVKAKTFIDEMFGEGTFWPKPLLGSFGLMGHGKTSNLTFNERVGHTMKSDGRGNYTWTQTGGHEILVSEMEDTHIKNVILILFKRKYFAEYGLKGLINEHLIEVINEAVNDTIEDIRVLNFELEKRGSHEIGEVLYEEQ